MAEVDSKLSGRAIDVVDLTTETQSHKENYSIGITLLGFEPLLCVGRSLIPQQTE